MPIDTADRFKELYATALRNRRTAATKLNAQSSRSHSVLTVRLSHRVGSRLATGKIHLIDLAGNEDNRVSGNAGKRLVESANINKSLFVLGQVIHALNTGEVSGIVPEASIGGGPPAHPQKQS
jgi:kinesin family member 22